MGNKGNKLPATGMSKIRTKSTKNRLFAHYFAQSRLVRLAELIAVLAFFVLIKSLMLYCMINAHLKALTSWLSLITPTDPDKSK